MTSFNPELQIGEPIETPSQAIVSDAFAPVSVKDAIGRTIEAARLKPSERFAIKRMMGAEAEIGGLFKEVFLVSHCRSIDGERINRPTSLLQVAALMDRLTDEGLRAIDQAIGIIYHISKNGNVEETAKN